MRTTFFLLAATAASASAATIWSRQATAPPTCALPCLNTGTNNVTLDGCADADTACQCRSGAYVQGVINCFATVCSSHDDVMTAIDFSTSYCGIAGVNTPAPGITTPLTQLHPSTGASGSGSSTPAPSSSSSNTAAAATTSTSSRNAAGTLEPRAYIAAFVLAAVGVAAGI